MSANKAETGEAPPRRQAILSAAAHLFSIQGFSSTTVRQIAERANIESGSIYYHFQSKNEILREVLVFAIDITSHNVRAAMSDLAEGAKPRIRVERALRAHLKTLHDYVQYTSTNVRFNAQIPLEVQTAVQNKRQEYSDFWHELLLDAREKGAILPGVNISLLRPLILGMLNHTMVWYDSSRGDIDELFDVIKVMISGIWTADN